MNKRSDRSGQNVTVDAIKSSCTSVGNHRAGVRIINGGCGTTPMHIRAIKQAVFD